MTRSGRPIRRRTRHRDATGSGTVWVLAVTGVLLAIAAAQLLVGAAMVARHRAAGAADLAALAAAGRLARAQPGACALARRVALRSGARLVACRAGPDGVVEVVAEAHAAGPAGRLGAARVAARAGPGPPTGR